MKSLFQSYRFPVIVTVLMVAAVGFWAYNTWREIQSREQEMHQRYARSSAESIGVVLNSLWHRGRLDSRRATQVLEGIMKNSPIRMIRLEQNGTTAFQVGELPPDDAGDSSEKTRNNGELLYRSQIHIGPDQAESQRSPTSTSATTTSQPTTNAVFAGDYTLTIGIGYWRSHGKGGPPKGGPPPQPLLGMMLTLAVALLFIFAALAAWMLAIRGRLLAEQLKSQRAKLAHLEELGLVAAGLAHETKNPLGIISGIAQQISSSPGISESNRSSLENIIDEVDKASARLGDFIAFAKPPNAKIAPVAADKLMNKIAAILRPDFSSAGVELSADCPLVKILADADMLRQIVVNLLLNSLVASGSGGKATVQIERIGNTATLTVRDTGSGIPPELLPNIFKPYVTGKATGHGLGLAIVKRFVEEHKWTISAQSQTGCGTTITISDILIAE